MEELSRLHNHRQAPQSFSKSCAPSSPRCATRTSNCASTLEVNASLTRVDLQYNPNLGDPAKEELHKVAAARASLTIQL